MSFYTMNDQLTERRMVLMNFWKILNDDTRDSDRKVLAARGQISMELDIVDAQQKAVAELEARHQAERDASEDGGYEDRDPLQNAVKGDLP